MKSACVVPLCTLRSFPNFDRTTTSKWIMDGSVQSKSLIHDGFFLVVLFLHTRRVSLVTNFVAASTKRLSRKTLILYVLFQKRGAKGDNGYLFCSFENHRNGGAIKLMRPM